MGGLFKSSRGHEAPTNSYSCNVQSLTTKVREAGEPLTLLVRQGHPRRALLVSGWLIIVYVLAMAVYASTFGH